MTKPYCPSNGTEGEIFMEAFCYRCARDTFDQQTGEGDPCQILGNALCFQPGDAEFPEQWVKDDDGNNPRCTAFEDKDLAAEKVVRPADLPGQMKFSFAEG